MLRARRVYGGMGNTNNHYHSSLSWVELSWIESWSTLLLLIHFVKLPHSSLYRLLGIYEFINSWFWKNASRLKEDLNLLLFHPDVLMEHHDRSRIICNIHVLSHPRPVDRLDVSVLPGTYCHQGEVLLYTCAESTCSIIIVSKSNIVHLLLFCEVCFIYRGLDLALFKSLYRICREI